MSRWHVAAEVVVDMEGAAEDTEAEGAVAMAEEDLAVAAAHISVAAVDTAVGTWVAVAAHSAAQAPAVGALPADPWAVYLAERIAAA